MTRKITHHEKANTCTGETTTDLKKVTCIKCLRRLIDHPVEGVDLWEAEERFMKVYVINDALKMEGLA